MRTFFGLCLAVGLLASVPGFAGNLTFDSGRTEWHTSQCTKPAVPPSILAAHPETSGEDMNALAGQYNAYIDQVQAYMNCISAESDHDQGVVSQAIAASAQKAIGEAQAEADHAEAQLHSAKQR